MNLKFLRHGQILKKKCFGFNTDSLDALQIISNLHKQLKLGGIELRLHSFAEHRFKESENFKSFEYSENANRFLSLLKFKPQIRFIFVLSDMLHP